MSKASERLAAMRDRTSTPGKKHVEPEFKPDHGTTFVVKRWYEEIRASPISSVVKAAGAYYAEAVKDGSFYAVPVGNLETLLEQHPGITFFYQCILVDVQQARRWLEERLDRLEAERHNYYMHDPEAISKFGVLKTTEASKMAKVDPMVMEMFDNVRLLAYHEHNMEALLAALDNIKYVLNHVVTIRKEKLEEVWVDPTSETKNA